MIDFYAKDFERMFHANGERFVRLDVDIRGKDCRIFGSVAPPDSRLVAFCLLAHALRQNGARRITAVLPYLAYARQDRPEPGRSMAAAWIGCLLASCGVTRVVTTDLHSAEAGRALGIPVTSIPSSSLFAPIVAARYPGASIVAPDDGAAARAEAVRRAARMRSPIVVCHKRRTSRGIAHLGMDGTPGGTAVIVDDILDTGDTLVSCCRALRRAGTLRIVVMVTHGLFTGKRWKRLFALGVEKIYVTDSVPQKRRGGVEVIHLGY